MLPWLQSSGSLGLLSMTDVTDLMRAAGNRENRFPIRLTSDRRLLRWLGEPISPTKLGYETPKAGAAKDPEQ
jgi:hypothetical protein